MPRTIEFRRRPPLWKAYLRFLVGSRPGLRDGDELPQLRARWNGVEANSGLLERYRACCRVEHEPGVPFHYPHVLVSPMHLVMLTEPEFPFRLLGAVHLRNHAIRYRLIDPSERLDFESSMAGCRWRPQGYEIDLDTQVFSAAEKVWAERTTFLVRGELSRHDPPHPLADIFHWPDGEVHECDRFMVPSAAGRRYAAISKDYNPIHVSRWLARLFGFRRDLVHGMWGLVRATHHVPELNKEEPVRVDVAFKGPLYMEHQVRVETTENGEKRHLRVFCGREERPAMQIVVRNVSPQSRPEAF